MIRSLALSIALLISPAGVMADSCANYGYGTQFPWEVNGQTVINRGASATNPVPISNGLLGQVTSLPFVVPIGQILIVESMGIETTYGAAILPFIGSGGSPTTANELFTGQAGYTSTIGTSQLWAGLNYHLPGGTILNVFLSAANQNNGTVYAWYMSGKLCNAAP